MYQNFISRHFSNQAGIIVFVNWPRAYCGVLRLTEAGFLRPDSPRTSPWNKTVKLCRRKWLWRILHCSGRHEHDAEHGDETIHDTVTLNQRCFAFIRPRTPMVYRYHVISRTLSHSAVFGRSRSGWIERHPPRRLAVEQLLYSSDCMGTGRAAQIDAKTNFRFGNIVPKQGKNDNKTSQQLKELHINEMLQRVTNFQTSFSEGIQLVCLMAKSPRKHTFRTPFSIG